MASSCPIMVSVQPHDHAYREGGPVDMCIRMAQDLVVFKRKGRCRLSLEQTEPEVSNLTLLRVCFGRGIRLSGKWYSCRYQHTMHPHKGYLPGRAPPPIYTVDFCVKARITGQLPHPMPLGEWAGTCEWQRTSWGMFICQHKTLLVKPEKAQEKLKRIVLPHEADSQRGQSRIVLP